MIISRGFICELHLKMLKNSRKLKIAGGLLVREGMGMEREEEEAVCLLVMSEGHS